VRLRMSPWLWERAKDSERLIVELEQLLNRNVMRLFDQPARFRLHNGEWREGAKRPVMLGPYGLKLVLRPSEEPGVDYLVVDIKKARREEEYEALTGRSLNGTVFKVLRPSEKIAEVVVVIRPRYLQLPQFLKTPIALAWDRLIRGMEQSKIRMGPDTVFLLTGVPDERWLRELDTALTDAQAGRVTTDSYETQRARELCEKYGQPCT